MQQVPAAVHQAIEELTFESQGVKMIALGNYALDFKARFVFLGFTKNGNKVILGDIHTSGPDGVKYKKRFGAIELRHNSQIVAGQVVPYIYWQLTTDGSRYSETVLEVAN